jgi:hypothetical protein
MFIIGNIKREIRTHHTHIVKYNEDEWNNKLNIRDYINNNIKEVKIQRIENETDEK